MAKVRVPASAGEEIIISTAGDEPKTYKVTDGEVTVAAADLSTFLDVVEGSKEVAKPAASSQKEK